MRSRETRPVGLGLNLYILRSSLFSPPIQWIIVAPVVRQLPKTTIAWHLVLINTFQACLWHQSYSTIALQPIPKAWLKQVTAVLRSGTSREIQRTEDFSQRLQHDFPSVFERRVLSAFLLHELLWKLKTEHSMSPSRLLTVKTLPNSSLLKSQWNGKGKGVKRRI